MSAFALASSITARQAVLVRGLQARRPVKARAAESTTAPAAAPAGLIVGNPTHVSLRPYFEVAEENMESFKFAAAECNTKMAAGRESKCVQYGWTQSGNMFQCWESYEGGEAVVKHLDRVGPNLDKLLSLSTLARFEVHGAPEELAKLKEPLKDLPVTYFEGITPTVKDPLAGYEDPLEGYCKENEDADECRVYDN